MPPPSRLSRPLYATLRPVSLGHYVPQSIGIHQFLTCHTQSNIFRPNTFQSLHTITCHTPFSLFIPSSHAPFQSLQAIMCHTLSNLFRPSCAILHPISSGHHMHTPSNLFRPLRAILHVISSGHHIPYSIQSLRAIKWHTPSHLFRPSHSILHPISRRHTPSNLSRHYMSYSFQSLQANMCIFHLISSDHILANFFEPSSDILQPISSDIKCHTTSSLFRPSHAILHPIFSGPYMAYSILISSGHHVPSSYQPFQAIMCQTPSKIIMPSRVTFRPFSSGHPMPYSIQSLRPSRAILHKNRLWHLPSSLFSARSVDSKWSKMTESLINFCRFISTQRKA